jgi:hypothetical protein
VSCIIRGHAALEVHFVEEFANITLSRALASNHQPLILRAVFLSSALLSSDSSSIARIERLVQLLLPSVIGHINSPSIDLSENVAALLTTLLHTQVGWRFLTETYWTEIEAALQERERWIAAHSNNNSGDEEGFPDEDRLSSDEEVCCTGVVAKLRSLLTSAVDVRFPAAVAMEETVTVTISSDDMKKMQIC